MNGVPRCGAVCSGWMRGEGLGWTVGVVTGVNAGVYECIRRGVWEAVSTKIEPGVRLH